MKVKYLINTEPVGNLRAWCDKRGYSIETFKGAIKRAKKKGKKRCTCKGFNIERI